jgi:hypothetical protein
VALAWKRFFSHPRSSSRLSTHRLAESRATRHACSVWVCVRGGGEGGGGGVQLGGAPRAAAPGPAARAGESWANNTGGRQGGQGALMDW